MQLSGACRSVRKTDGRRPIDRQHNEQETTGSLICLFLHIVEFGLVEPFVEAVGDALVFLIV